MFQWLRSVLTGLVQRFNHDRDGAVAVIFALTTIPIAGAVAAAVDYSRASNIRTDLQATLDSAVLAGAKDGTANKNNVATSFFNSNLSSKDGVVATPSFTSNADGSYSGKVTASVPTAFLGVLNIPNINVSAQSTASLLKKSPLCAIALNPTASGGFQVTGTGVFNAQNCAVQVDSASTAAIGSKGSASAKADEFCVVGDGSGRFSPTPKTKCTAVPDPFANLPAPTVGACKYNNTKVTTSTTFSPGVYCGGLSVSGDIAITFLAGTYIIKDGPLNVSVTSDLTGTGVTFYLTGSGATTSFGGGGQITLSAPISGPLTGILFFQAPLAAPAGTSKLMADSSASYEGVLYFPTQNLQLYGQGAGSSRAGWTAIVANTITTTDDGWYTLKYGGGRVPFPDVLKRSTPILTH